MDRIDIHIDVPAVKFKDLASDDAAESSADIRQRVISARRIREKSSLCASAKPFNTAHWIVITGRENMPDPITGAEYA